MVVRLIQACPGVVGKFVGFLGAPWRPSGSCGLVGFILARPDVHSGGLSGCSFGRALVVIGFILGSLGSFGCALRVVGFVQARRWGPRVHSVSMG